MDFKSIAFSLIEKLAIKHSFLGKKPINQPLYDKGEKELVEGTEKLLNGLVAKNSEDVRIGVEQATVGIEDIVASYIEKPDVK